MSLNETIVEDAAPTWFGELSVCILEHVAEEKI